VPSFILYYTDNVFISLVIYSITPNKSTLLFITYLSNVSPICYGVSHAIFRENLCVSYSTTHIAPQN